MPSLRALQHQTQPSRSASTAPAVANPPAPKPPAPAIPSEVFVAEKPEDAKPLAEVKKNAKEGDKVVVDILLWPEEGALAEGVILEVRTMRALDLTAVESKSDDVRLAVEMPAGWFERQRVTAGARVDLEAIRRGLTARGFDSTRYLP